MRFGSLFSGVEAASVAWQPLGWQCRWVAEIDPFACAVLKHHYPDVANLGDVERIDADAVEPVDLVVFGSPCQSFSVAGNRLGLDDPRGNLALVGLRLVSKIRPRWVVFENVPGLLSSDGGRDFGAFLGLLGECGYGFAYAVLDAQHFGVPQRRRRVFVVGYLGDWRPPAAVLFEQSCLQWDTPPRREAGERNSCPVANGPEGGSGYRNDADTAEDLIAFNNTGQGWWNAAAAAASVRKGNDNGNGGARESTLIAFGGSRQSGPIDVSTAVNAHGGPHGRLDFESETFITYTLRADGIGIGGMSVRRLTPVECERLQGFPDGYTDIQYRAKPAADGPRYRAIGNSMAVPVICWLGRRIALIDVGGTA